MITQVHRGHEHTTREWPAGTSVRAVDDVQESRQRHASTAICVHTRSPGAWLLAPVSFSALNHKRVARNLGDATETRDEVWSAVCTWQHPNTASVVRLRHSVGFLSRGEFEPSTHSVLVGCAASALSVPTLHQSRLTWWGTVGSAGVWCASRVLGRTFLYHSIVSFRPSSNETCPAGSAYQHPRGETGHGARAFGDQPSAQSLSKLR